MPKLKTQFCMKGHDKNIVGRRSDGSCKECHFLYNQKYKKENYDQTQRHFQKANWTKSGILNNDGKIFSRLDFDYHYQLQQGKCFICHKHQSDLTHALCADHNHTTKKFRGLLCKNCNMGIGLLGDSMTTLTEATKYLQDRGGK